MAPALTAELPEELRHDPAWQATLHLLWEAFPADERVAVAVITLSEKLERLAKEARVTTSEKLVSLILERARLLNIEPSGTIKNR